MGNKCCGKKGDEKEDEEKVGFDSIYYDENGNMRVGKHGRVRKGPEGEFARVLRLDKQVLDDGTAADQGRWCVIESGWVSSWLAFVYYNDSSPAPGKIQNSKLLDNTGYPIDGIQLASDKKSGHYRLIREPVWDLYCELYQNSGPKIWVDQEPYNDPDKWEVDEAWLEAHGIDMEERKLRRPTGVLEEAKDADADTPPPPAPVEEAKAEENLMQFDVFDDNANQPPTPP